MSSYKYYISVRLARSLVTFGFMSGTQSASSLLALVTLEMRKTEFTRRTYDFVTLEKGLNRRGNDVKKLAIRYLHYHCFAQNIAFNFDQIMCSRLITTSNTSNALLHLTVNASVIMVELCACCVIENAIRI
uniref:Uncharacterized protein n=1 Tax=Glossina pallidipes TaxID=7398 RepID=A0A1A9Z1S1_GLOPL